MGRLLGSNISFGTIGNPQTSFDEGKYEQKSKKMFMNIQLFAINKQKQARHDKNNTTGRSVLFGGEKAAQEIIDKFSGKGIKLPHGKERVETDHIIGEYVSDGGKIRVKSNVAIIVHSKTGDHVYPGNPSKGGNK